MKSRTKNPLENSSRQITSRTKRVEVVANNNLSLVSVDTCPMCHKPMKQMKIGQNNIDAYICIDDRVALPVEDGNGHPAV